MPTVRDRSTPRGEGPFSPSHSSGTRPAARPAPTGGLPAPAGVPSGAAPSPKHCTSYSQPLASNLQAGPPAAPCLPLARLCWGKLSLLKHLRATLEVSQLDMMSTGIFRNPSLSCGLYKFCFGLKISSSAEVYQANVSTWTQALTPKEQFHLPSRIGYETALPW